MPTLQLFRIRVHRPHQIDMFAPIRPPSEMLLKAIEERPVRTLSGGSEWRIANLSTIDENSVYFRIGRRSPKLQERVVHGDFEDGLGEEPLSTAVVLDYHLELCGILSRPQLAKNQMPIAGQLLKLLRSSHVAAQTRARFEIGPVLDPSSFLESLRSAKRVINFRFNVTRPNIYDTERLFMKPAQQFVNAANAQTASIQLKDPQSEKGIDVTAIEPIVRDAAGTGQEASARILATGALRATTKYLKMNLVRETIDDVDPHTHRKSLMDLARELYNGVRYGK